MGWDPAAVTVGRGALAAVDVVLAQGATNRWRLRYSTGTPPTPVDLTGWTARAQVRASTSAQAPWLTLDSVLPADGTVTLGGPDGTVTLTVPYQATEGPAWDDRRYGAWDVELTSTAGDRVRLAAGTVTVSHEVTRG